jgi:hypothetical protein
MEMTRRVFFQYVLKTASAFVLAAYLVGESVSPRKYIRALRHKNYPGSIKPLSNINTQGKWSG